MKAMVLAAFGSPLVCRDVEKPRPGPGEVLVRIRSCGVCFTDVKIIDGAMAQRPALPHILGHEPAGEIAELGEGVDDVAVGDRVSVYFYVPCGTCFFCRKGLDTSCERLSAHIGFNVDGAYAEYLAVPAANVARIADGVSFAQGGIIADAIATTVQGLEYGIAIQPGETVVLVGVGGLGLHAIQVARHARARVVAVDRVGAKLELARKLGADIVINSADEDVAQAVRDITEGRGADASVDLVGLAETNATCLDCLRPGGRMLVLGYRAGVDLRIPTADIVVRQLTVSGSRAASRRAFRRAVDLVNAGVIEPVVTEHFALEDANAALDRLRQGAVVGRAVLDLDG